MINYNWTIENLDCYSERDGYTDVVFTVHWRVIANDGHYTASNYGTVNLTRDPAAPFTAYADLTQQQVIDWTKSAMGAEQVAQIEASLAASIDAQINPPVVSPPLPWN